MLRINLVSANSTVGLKSFGALNRVFVVVFVSIGVAIAIAACSSIALPPFTVTSDSYPSIASKASNSNANLSHVVFVRREGAFVQIPYQLYDGEEMISAGQGNNLCHIYQTSAGKHTLGMSFVAGTGTVGDIPRLRFRFIDAEFKPSNVYYVSINIGDTFLGGFVGGLQPISARLNNSEDLPKWLAACRLVKFDVETARREWVERYGSDFKPMFTESFQEWRIQPNKPGLLGEDGFAGFLQTAASP